MSEPQKTTKNTKDKEEKKQDLPSEAKSEAKEIKKEAKIKKNKSEYTEIEPKEIKTGMLIRVHQKIVDTNSKGEEKERIQVFQGMVLARKHGNETGSTITVRKISEGIGVEKIFPLNMPSITKIELVRKYKITQSKPYYLRTTKKRLTEIK